ncbi:MAG: putative salt-induced outer membrane protein YdiY [Polyangiales bacterium]|jgi:putative salt-induced outer membrane protein YdiY
MMSRSLLLGLFVAFAAPMVASAQTPATPTDAAQFTESASTDAPEENKSEWNIAAGGVFNSGNTRSWSLTAGTSFGVVRGRHGLSFSFLLAYGRAALRDPVTGEFGDTLDVARNTNTTARYDFYLTPNDALFVAARHRWDTFAGLDTRLQAQVGYLRNFVNEDNHRVWGEIGYDFTFDNFDPDPLIDPMTMMELDGTDSVHSARLYLGYKNQLNEHVLFTTGLEALLDLQDIADNTRLNFDAGLQVTVVDSLQLGIAFKLLYDQEPVQGRETVDTITTLNLLYSLL